MTYNANGPGAGDSEAGTNDAVARLNLTLLSTALKTAEAGWPVFPCRPGGKAPLTKHGFKDASTDPSFIAWWWKLWPGANIGLPTGAPGPDVIDIDVKHVDGLATAQRLQDKGLLEGAFAEVRTPSGGTHLYYPGTKQRNAVNGKHGVDFRSAGGYVLAPVSVVDGNRYSLISRSAHADGQPVKWASIMAELTGKEETPEQEEFARIGTPVTGDKAAYATAAFRNEVQRVLEAQEGERNDTLNRATFSLWQLVLAGLLDHIKVEDALMRAAMRVGLSRLEARSTIASARIAARPRRGVA